MNALLMTQTSSAQKLDQPLNTQTSSKTAMAVGEFQTNATSKKGADGLAELMTTGEQSSINSFKSFAYQMLKLIQAKMLAKLDELYGTN